jgi:hypothetical protein
VSAGTDPLPKNAPTQTCGLNVPGLLLPDWKFRLIFISLEFLPALEGLWCIATHIHQLTIVYNMSQTNTGRNLSKDAALKIISSRIPVSAAMVGQLIRTTIVGNGTTVPLTDKTGAQVNGSDGQPLFKHIYNVKARSEVAQMNERNRGYLKAALGGDEEALNTYLNKTQVSFGVILRAGQVPPFVAGQVVDGIVDMVTTENGSLLSLKNVTSPAAKVINTKAVSSLEDLLGGTDEFTSDTKANSASEQPEDIMAQS